MFFLAVLKIEPTVSQMLGETFTTEPHLLQPGGDIFHIIDVKLIEIQIKVF